MIGNTCRKKINPDIWPKLPVSQFGYLLDNVVQRDGNDAAEWNAAAS